MVRNYVSLKTKICNLGIPLIYKTVSKNIKFIDS